MTQVSCLPSQSPLQTQQRLKCCSPASLALYNQSSSSGPRSSLLSTPFPYKHRLFAPFPPAGGNADEFRAAINVPL